MKKFNLIIVVLMSFFTTYVYGGEIVEVKLSNGLPFFDCEMDGASQEEIKQCESFTQGSKKISGVSLKVEAEGPVLILATQYMSEAALSGPYFKLSSSAINKSQVSVELLQSMLLQEKTKISCLDATERSFEDNLNIGENEVAADVICNSFTF